MTYFIIFLVHISAIINNPYLYINCNTRYKLQCLIRIYKLRVYQRIWFLKLWCLSKNSVKTEVKITYYLVTVIVNKTAFIGNSFIRFSSLNLSHHNKQEYVNLIPTSFFFLPKIYFLLKNNVKKDIWNYLFGNHFSQ